MSVSECPWRKVYGDMVQASHSVLRKWGQQNQESKAAVTELSVRSAWGRKKNKTSRGGGRRTVVSPRSHDLGLELCRGVWHLCL